MSSNVFNDAQTSFLEFEDANEKVYQSFSEIGDFLRHKAATTFKDLHVKLCQTFNSKREPFFAMRPVASCSRID